MLRSLRNQTQSIFFKAFLGLLIIGFAMWGVGDLTGNNNQKPILSVESKNISSQEILDELNKVRYNMPQRPSLEESIKNGLLNNVLNKFEQEILINSEAVSLNLHVPKNIQTKAISEEKAFRDPLGKFSQTKFLKSLNNAGLSENKYLEMINTEAYFKQLSMPFSLNTYYSDKIANKIIEWQNQTRDIEYAFLKKIKKEEIKKPTPVILQGYYKKNKEFYKIPITRNIKYIELKPSDFNSQVKINEDDIKELYGEDKTKFITEETRNVLQLVTQDKIKANNFVKKIKSKDDFINFSKKDFNLDINDINIGFIKKNDLPLQTRDLVFEGNINDVIGPIKSNFGYIVYKLISIAPKKIKSYNDVYEQIKQNLIKEKSIELLYQKIDILDDLIAEGNNLSEITLNSSVHSQLKIKEINQVSQYGTIHPFDKDYYQLKKSNSFLKSIWKTNINELSNVVEMPNDSYALIEVIKENKEIIPIFNKVEKKVYKDWIEKELKIKTELKLKKLIKNQKVTFISLKKIKRDQKNVIKQINNNSIINEIFELKQNELKVINKNEGSVAIKVNNINIVIQETNQETSKKLNLSLSKSFFNDYSKYYIEILSEKHKLKRNYQQLENDLGKIETN